MRSTSWISILAAASLVAAPARAQVQGAQPQPPGDIGPAPVNPQDTGRGAIQGTNPQGAQGAVVVPQPNAGAGAGVGAQPGAGVGAGVGVGVQPGVVPPVVAPGRLPVPPARRAGEPATVGDLPFPETFTPVPGGLTADAAAERATRESHAVRASNAGVRAAEAQQTEVARSMIPSVQASARYTRLSEFEPGRIQAFNTPGCLMNLMQCQANPGAFQQMVVLQQPILDQFALRVSATIPLSDIPLRLLRLYEAAGLTAEAQRLQTEVSRAQAALAGREAFYEYVRAVGQQLATRQSVEAMRRRRDDMLRFVEAGAVARADLLRIEATLADLQRVEVLAGNGVELTAATLRQRLHLPEGARIDIGEALEAEVLVPANLQDLIARATRGRPEVRSLERQIDAVGANRAATWAQILPSVAVAGNVDYANPNPRIFPQTQTFQATWDVTVQVAWSPTQAFVAEATMSRLSAQRAQLVAQRAQLREGLEMEVRVGFANARAAQAQIESARAAYAAAVENYRVRRERVGAGAAVATDLAEAESELLRARLAVINAHVDMRLAVARLRRAIGEGN